MRSTSLPGILRGASEHMELVFEVDVKEVHHSYVRLRKLDLT